MSMQNIEHQGYGVDLGEFQSATENFNEVINNLIDNYDATDYINDNSLECVADTPVNSDGFSYLVYIPAVIPVTNNPHKIKPYTEEEAHEAIFKTIKDAIVANNLDKSLILNKTEAQFLIELREFIDKNADYSYNHDWSDLV